MRVSHLKWAAQSHLLHSRCCVVPTSVRPKHPHQVRRTPPQPGNRRPALRLCGWPRSGSVTERDSGITPFVTGDQRLTQHKVSEAYALCSRGQLFVRISENRYSILCQPCVFYDREEWLVILHLEQTLCRF